MPTNVSGRGSYPSSNIPDPKFAPRSNTCNWHNVINFNTICWYGGDGTVLYGLTGIIVGGIYLVYHYMWYGMAGIRYRIMGWDRIMDLLYG